MKFLSKIFLYASVYFQVQLPTMSGPRRTELLKAEDMKGFRTFENYVGQSVMKANPKKLEIVELNGQQAVLRNMLSNVVPKVLSL